MTFAVKSKPNSTTEASSAQLAKCQSNPNPDLPDIWFRQLPNTMPTVRQTVRATGMMRLVAQKVRLSAAVVCIHSRLPVATSDPHVHGADPGPI